MTNNSQRGNIEKTNSLSSSPMSKRPVITELKKSATSILKEPATSVLKEPATSKLKEPATSNLKEPATPVLKEPASSKIKEPVIPEIKKPRHSRDLLSGIHFLPKQRLQRTNNTTQILL